MAFAHGVEHEDRAGDGEARLDHRAKLGDGVALAADDTGEIGEDGVEGTRVRVTTEEAGCLGGQLQSAVWHDGMYLTRTPLQPSMGTASGIRADCLSRSEEHTSELQSLMRISYAVFCLQKKKQRNNNTK